MMLQWAIVLLYCCAPMSGRVVRRSEVLDSDGAVVVSWNADDVRGIFTVHLEAKCKGVIGVGFSTDGRSSGRGDFAVGWVAHGVASVLDMYMENDELFLDEKQDYQLLSGAENDTHTILRFQRKFDTCDVRDWKISNDTVRITYSYSDKDPVDQNIAFHSMTKRGHKSFYILEEGKEKIRVTSDMSIWDVRLPNVPLMGRGTIYHCKIFKAPKTSRKHQVIGYEALKESNHKIHHMVLYECHVGTSNSSSVYEPHLADQGHQCYIANMPKAYTHCSTILIAWGVGSQGDVTPFDVGFPLGEEFGGASYFMLEVHYELSSQQMQSVIDNSGLRLYLTNKVRRHEASVVNIGHVVSPLQIIPPGEKQFVSVAHCGSACTERLLPETGINVYGLTLQAHSLATAITLRHVRNGVELTPIVDEKNYDATYLQSHRLLNPIKVFPGDHLLLECSYDTISRNNTIVGGLNMHNEMCLAFLQYYPRASLSECQSWPAIGLLTSWFHIKLGQQINGFVVEDSQQTSSKTLTDFLERYRWAGRSQAFQRDIRFGQYLPFCLKEGRYPANLSVIPVDYPQITFPHYAIRAQCSVDSTQHTQQSMTSYTKVVDAKSVTSPQSVLTSEATTLQVTAVSHETSSSNTKINLKITEPDWLDGESNNLKLTIPASTSHPMSNFPRTSQEGPNELSNGKESLACHFIQFLFLFLATTWFC